VRRLSGGLSRCSSQLSVRYVRAWASLPIVQTTTSVSPVAFVIPASGSPKAPGGSLSPRARGSGSSSPKASATGAPGLAGELVEEAVVAEASASERANRVCTRMRSRHLELLKNLSEKNKEREEQQKREESRLRKRESILRDRVLHKRSFSQPPGPPACEQVVESSVPEEPPPPAPSALQALGAVGLSSSGPPSSSATTEERRQWQLRCNSDIERRQEDALRKLVHVKQRDTVLHEREKLKREWRAHNASKYLLSNCRDAGLREYLESKGKPRALPKLPVQLSASGGSDQLSAAIVSTGLAIRSLTNADSEDYGAADTIEDGAAEAIEDDGAGSTDGVPDDAATASGAAAAATAAVAAAAAALGQQVATTAAASTAEVPASAAPREARSPAKSSSAAPATVSRGVDRFLGRLRLSRAAAHCTDMAEWKRRNGCPKEAQVFICAGGYPDFRDALLKRGWFHNPEKESRHFDLKWGMASDIDHERLQPHQVVNHFDRCRDLTTKIGLSLNLRNSAWYSGVDLDSFYPRAYDLYDPLERADFVLNFKFTKAESILRQFLRHVDEGDEMTFSQDVISVCNKICIRMTTDPEEVLDCPVLAEGLTQISAEEWSLLKEVCLEDVSRKLEDVPKEKDLEEMINRKPSSNLIERRSEKEREREAEKVRKMNQSLGKEKKKKKKKKDEKEEISLQTEISGFSNPRGQHLVRQARDVIAELEELNRQHTIHGHRNAWIVKPAGKSRGRGIQVLRELDEIFKATESDGYQWISQKYIEQPQLIHGYKFDIRQWVLVTDWNPLTVYIWKQPYLRFAGQKYDENLSSLSEYMHLVNNSIIKYMDGFAEKNVDLDASGYMWFRQQYEEWMHKKYCKCKRHQTPFLKPPPYTCETFGVKFEDVKFIAKEEDEDEDDERGDEAPPKSASDEATPKSAPSNGSAHNSTETCLPCTSPEPAPPLDRPEDAEGNGSDSEDAPDAPESPCSRESAEEAAPGDASASQQAAQGKSSSAPAQEDAEAAGVESDDDGEEKECEDLWETCIKPQIADIITWSLLCVVESIQNRKNTYELYGYDFMVAEGSDGRPKVWLIEVNSSPACDYSTPVTTPLVKKMMEDTAKIMVDMREDPNVDTGEWERLEHAYQKPVPLRTNNLDKLEIVGTKVKPPKNFFRQQKQKKKRKASKAQSSHDRAAETADDGAGEEDEDAEDGDGDGDGEADD